MTVTAAAPGVPPGRYRLVHVMRAEWVKLRSVRSVRWVLAAVPRRRLLLAAKAAVLAAVALALGEVTVLASFLAGQAVLAGRAQHATLASRECCGRWRSSLSGPTASRPTWQPYRDGD